MLVYERPNRCSRGTGFTDEHDQNIQRSTGGRHAPRVRQLWLPPGMLGRALYSYRAPPKSTRKTPDRPPDDGRRGGCSCSRRRGEHPTPQPTMTPK